MADQSAYLRTGLRKRMPDYDQPRVRVATDLAIIEDLKRRPLDQANGSAAHCREIEGKIRQILKDTPAPTLDTLARKWGYKATEHLAEPGFGVRSEILQQPRPGYQGWAFTGESRYRNLPDAPSATVDPKFAPGRSRYADLPETPRLRDGSIDCAKLNEMAGHGRAHPRWR
jgi:hypothetical protein